MKHPDERNPFGHVPPLSGAASLASAKRKIQGLRQQQSKCILKIVEEIAVLKDSLSECEGFDNPEWQGGQVGSSAADTTISPRSEADLGNVAPLLFEWLRREIGATEEEADTYLRFTEVLNDASNIVSSRGVSIQVIHSLINTEERARLECLERIERGEIIDAAFIENLAEAHRRKTMPSSHADFDRRRARLKQATDELARSVRVRLEEAADDLLRLMGELHQKHVYWTNDGPCYDEDEEYGKDVRRIARWAASAREDFEMIFGSDHPDLRVAGELGLTDDVAASFALAWHALRDLELKRFDPFSCDPEDMSSPIQSRIAYLAGTTPTVAPVRPNRSPPVVPPKRLKVLDISGGTGSATLGLDTAGFKSFAVYESNEQFRRVLKENRPDWEVLDFPMAAEFEEEFSIYSELDIDLITSSRTLTPDAYTRPIGELRPTVSEVTKMLKLVKPKAFFFEVDPFVKEGDRKIKAELAQLGSDLGYDLRWCSLDSSSLGLVQSGSRNVVVGLRVGVIGKFSMPVVAETHQKFLLDVIRDQLSALINLASNTADDIQWISEWMKNAEGKPAPFFFRDKDDHSTNWGQKLKIHIGVYPETPKKLADLRSKKSGRFRLSLEMLKRLQGIPDQWKVESRLASKDSEAGSKLSEVETAVPPILAKLVGLGLYTALTGKTVDVDAALASPLLSDRYVVGWPRFGNCPTLVPADGVQPSSGLRRAPSNFDSTAQGRSLAAWNEQFEPQTDDGPDEQAFTAR